MATSVEIYNPNFKSKASAYINSTESYKELYKESIEHNSEFREKQAKELLYWQHDFQQVNDSDFNYGMISWFLGDKLNACENCVDRHVKDRGDQVAIIWEKDEPGQEQRIPIASYCVRCRGWLMSYDITEFVSATVWLFICL